MHHRSGREDTILPAIDPCSDGGIVSNFSSINNTLGDIGRRLSPLYHLGSGCLACLHRGMCRHVFKNRRQFHVPLAKFQDFTVTRDNATPNNSMLDMFEETAKEQCYNKPDNLQ